jgi:hypothetical protein
MCQTAMGLISKALHEVDNAESLLKIKNLIALFMQTMNVCLLPWCFNMALLNSRPQTWEFAVGAFDSLLLTLFKNYAELLKRRFSDDFQEVAILTSSCGRSIYSQC